MSTAAVVASIFCAGLCGAIGIPGAVSQIAQLINRLKLKGRLAEPADRPRARGAEGESGKSVKSVKGGGLLMTLLQSGVPLMHPLANFLLGFAPLHRICSRYKKALATKGYAADVAAVLELTILLFLAVFALVYVVVGIPFVAFFAVVVAALLVNSKTQKILVKWEKLLIEQIPDALRALGVCFAVGFSLQQAFEQVAKETQAPLGDELKRTSYDINAGKSVNEALSDLEARIKVEDLRFAVIALEIQQKTGGSLQELLENAADAVVASTDLRRQLEVQTSQARMSAKVVTILPLLLVAALSLSMEGYLATFFSSFEGLMILISAAAMELVGILLIRKILGLNLG